MLNLMQGKGEKYFRWRAGEITRLEGFSDAVFAFAVTLLVVSLEVPRSFHELMSAMSGFLAFGVCFAMLATIWYEHHLYFRRYGFQNATIHALNLTLLFVVLLYVYPLKFLFSLLIGEILRLDPATIPHVAPGDSRPLLTIYGIGFAAVSAIFAILFRYASRHADELDLDEAERLQTREHLVYQSAYVVIGLMSAGLAQLLPERIEGIAGFLYLAIGPVRAWTGSYFGRRARVAAEKRPRASQAQTEIDKKHHAHGH